MKQIQNQRSTTVIFEDDWNQDPKFSDHGARIKIATLFGSCEYRVKQKEVTYFGIAESIRK